MVLLGMTNTGKVIVADSATRKWSGKKQRIEVHYDEGACKIYDSL